PAGPPRTEASGSSADSSHQPGCGQRTAARPAGDAFGHGTAGRGDEPAFHNPGGGQGGSGNRFRGEFTGCQPTTPGTEDGSSHRGAGSPGRGGNHRNQADGSRRQGGDAIEAEEGGRTHRDRFAGV